MLVGRFSTADVSGDLIVRPILEKASMLRDAGVRGKLFAVLAIPTLLLVVATGWLVGGQVQSSRQAGQVKAVTDVAIQLNRVVHSLQLERTVTLGFLQAPAPGARNGVLGQRQYTDSQLRVLRTKIAHSPIDSMSARIQAAAAQAAEAQAELVGGRKAIDAGHFDAIQADAFYAKTIATDLQLPGVIAASASPQLAQRLQAEEALSTTIEYASHERDLVELAYLDGRVTQAEFGQASALAAQQSQSLQDFQRSAPNELFVGLDAELAAADSAQLNRSRRHLNELLKGSEPDHPGSVDWLNAANPRIASMVTTEGRLVTDIANVAAALQSSEQLRAGIFGAAGLFGLVLAVLLAAVLSQRITLPLRRLTLAAAEIGEELPRMVERMQRPGEGPGVVVEPIPVESNDEIGRLAQAFNTVNEVTLRVAEEQAALRASIAEMFVNVARRNQVLLGRQLAQLDKMESREEDPDLLKNLFRLDHLATRMRRNAESLLVLAGIDSTRRLRQAMPLSDVIRTAVGEIEAYERVDPSVSDDPDVSGRHALPIAHLLAELLENATHFSDPGSRVVVAAALTGHGVDVTITDYGLGMSDEEIAQANENIAHPPVAEIAVSQRLGLFVVGRIAARLGATASLRKGRSAGTVVTVGLPLDVFEGLQADEPVAAEHPIETIVAADAVVDDELLDEPVRDDAVAAVPALVGALAVATAPDVPIPAIAFFDPYEIALSRLPQVDVAALMAEAEADKRSHAIAAPLAPEPGGRRLLPRRSRSDEPVVPADDAPVVAVSLAEVLDAEVPVDEVPVGVAPVGLVDDQSAGHDTEQSEIASHARRRGSFFARRRETPPVESIETQEPETAVEPALVTAEHAGPQADEEPEVAPFEFPPAAPEPTMDEPLAVVAADEPAVRAGLLGRRQWIADEPVVATAEPVVATVEPVVRRGLFGRRKSIADEPLVVADVVAEPSDAEVLFAPVAEEPVVLAPAPTAVDEVVVEDVVAEEPVELVVPDQPGRRRGLFGRRRPVDETLAAEPVAESEELASAQDLFAPVAGVRESFASHLPEPVAEPEPLPLAYATAIDILPGRPMGRGKHAAKTPAPAPETRVAPAAPVTAYAAPALAAPPAPLAPPDALAPVRVEASAVPPLLQRELSPVAPSAPPRQASATEPAPTPVSQPTASATMSELDQLALSAELQKSALSELRGLYEPSFARSAAPVAEGAAARVVEGAAPVAEAPVGLIRRQRRAVEVVAETVPVEPARARDASEVRGMLAGFRAGVERGRSGTPDAPPDAGDDAGHDAGHDAEHTDDRTD